MRKVLLIRPEEWGNPIAPWFATYYPGVQLLAFEGTDNEVLAGIASYYGKVVDPIVTPPPPPPVIAVATEFSSPVGTEIERAQCADGKWPGAWYDATNFGTRYQLPGTTTYAIHTGADLNLPGNADAKSPVYAPANGLITVAADYAVWGNIVIVEHTLPDKSKRWSRLAHLETMAVKKGDVVKIGQQVGIIGDAHGRYSYHLHYDCLKKENLSTNPTHWPGDNSALVLANYEPLLEVSPAKPIAVGLHDIGGAEWMLANGKQGYALDHVCVTDKVVKLDYARFASAGIQMIVRLNYGYADGTGTLPPPAKLAAFEAAVAATMIAAKGVKYFQYGNEVNNASEWPAGYPVTATGYADSYNRVWKTIPNRVLMGPSPIDPYFGPGSNNRDWWTTILGGITGADVLFLHPKTQSNDPTEIDSLAMFSDDPLKWQYLHFNTIATSLEVVPARFKDKPVILAEVNPQRTPNGLGWLADNTEWIRRAKTFVACWNDNQHQKINGIVFYRWADDDWPLHDKPKLISAMFA